MIDMTSALQKQDVFDNTTGSSDSTLESLPAVKSYDKRLPVAKQGELSSPGEMSISQPANENIFAAQLTQNKQAALSQAIALVSPKKQPALNVSSRTTFVVKHEWEGVVERIGNEYISATLLNVRGNGVEAEVAEIPVGEFSDIDRRRMKIGSIFRWVIGIQRRGQTQSRVSQVALRHLPAWTNRELVAAEAEGLFLSEKLKSQVR